MNDLSAKELEKLLKKKKEEEQYIDSENGRYSKKILKELFRDYRIFVLIVLFIFYKTGNEPVVLVGAVTTFLGVEVLQLARIKISKTNPKKLSFIKKIKLKRGSNNE